MDNRIKKYLHDIHTGIINIDRYIGDRKDFNDFVGNPMLQDAVERNLEIIGEAVNQILIQQPDISISNARRIVDARNKIIHGYDEIQPEQIWSIIINHLPILQDEVIRLLMASGHGGRK